MKKKVLSCAVALALVGGAFGVLPESADFDTAITASAEDLVYGDYTYHVLDDGTVEIYSYSGSLSKVTIPSQIAGKNVTKIGAYSFYDNEYVKSIVIPSTVREIEKSGICIGVDTSRTTMTIDSANPYLVIKDNVLYSKDMTKLIYILNMDSVKSFIVPSTVKTIGASAFEYCRALTSVTIPSGVTTIEDSAFASCESLTSITIPDTATTLGTRLFNDCDNLKTATLPKKIVSADSSWWFNGCQKLTSVNIPQNLTSIGQGMFYGCTNLIKITVPDTVTSIGSMAFMGVGVSSLIIPKNVKSIDSAAFYGCSKLTSITLPDGLEKIGIQAFNRLTKLKTITIPKKAKVVVEEGQGDFYGEFYESTNLTVRCFAGSPMETYLKNWNNNHSDAAWKTKYQVIHPDFKGCTFTADKAVFGYTGKAKAPTVTIKDGSYTLKQGTDYTLTYKNNKNIGTGTITVTGKGDYTGTKNLSFTIIPSNVGGFKAAATSASAVKLSWNKVSGAQGYIVYQYNTSTKKWVRIAKTGNVNTYTVKSLKAGTTYKYAVKAYKTVSGKDYTSAKYPTITTSTKPAKVSFKAAAASKAVKFSWSKVTGATNYIVYYRVKGTSSWKSVKVANNVTSKTISGLVKGKTYEVTVKAVRTVNKVNYNGAYDVKTVKVK